jgi:hypothetical protein
MKKAAVAALLAVSAMMTPGAVSHLGTVLAQDAAAKPITIDDPAEFAMYDAASKLQDPKAQAPAFEAYLAKYPKSVLRKSVLSRIMLDYSTFDAAKTIAAADNVLADNPQDFQALVLEAIDRYQQSQSITDPAARQTATDSAADFATRALAAPKSSDMTDAQYDQFKKQLAPTLHSIVGNDAFAKKDYLAAIKAYLAELASADPAKTAVPGPILADTYFLGYAYSQITPPDYVSCTFYATRAASFAPATDKPTLQKTADFCYKRYHGGADGYDAVVTAASNPANVNPPSGFAIVPAPSDADRAHAAIAATPDLSKMALEDREFVLQYGTQKDDSGKTDADKVFDVFKGKDVEIPGAIVVAATPDQLQVAVSDDAQQQKPPVADYTFNMKTPLRKVPAVGDKVTLTGVYTSYTAKPVMIVMSDSEIVPAKAPVKRPTTVHHK